MNTTIIGYPRIGDLRELKFASEKYFRGEITAAELETAAEKIRLYNLQLQKKSGIDLIPSNDFSFYDGVLHAKAKIPNVAYAYHMKADSLEVELDLDPDGIQFYNGIIYGEKETFDFSGDVMWNHEEPHTSWDVRQRNGGHAFAYITWTDSTTIRDVLLFPTMKPLDAKNPEESTAPADEK